MTLADAVSRLRQFEARLSNPVHFYEERRPHWVRILRELTAAIVRESRPPEANERTWAARAQTLATKVTAELLAADTTGIVFRLNDAAPDATAQPRGSTQFSASGITIDDLLRFIQAGREGDELGKRLDERDEGKSDLQIAWRMMYALKRQKNNWEALAGHIRDFLGNPAQPAPADDILQARILDAWIKVFVPLAFADFQRFVASEIRRLG